MTITVNSSTSTHRVRALAEILPGAAALLYAGIQLDGGIVVAALRSTSSVPKDRLNFPLSGSAASTAEIVWGISQVAFLIALFGFRSRSAVTASRAGRSGTALALVGGFLFLGAHALCLSFPNTLNSDAAGIAAATLFGVGSVLIAAGFLIAGTAVLRGRAWSGWRRFTPLVVGAWMAVMIPLQFTGLLQLAVAVHAISVGAFGLAMLTECET